MDIAREDLSALVEHTWQTLFGEPACEDVADADRKWDFLSCISIRGAWNGRLVVSVEEATAKRLAGCLLDVDPSELAEDEILDAVRELANILGGNLKAMVPQPSTLGLPELIRSELGNSPDPNEFIHYCLNYVWSELRFSVMIASSDAAER